MYTFILNLMPFLVQVFIFFKLFTTTVSRILHQRENTVEECCDISDQMFSVDKHIIYEGFFVV